LFRREKWGFGAIGGQNYPDSAIPKTIGWQLSVDSLERAPQDSPSSNFFKTIDSVFEHPPNGIFPTD